MDGFKALGTAEAKKLRATIISILQEYGEASDKQAAGEMLIAKMMGIEVAVSRLMARTIAKARDRFRKAGRTLGSTSKQAKAAIEAAEGLDTIVQALDMMQRAARDRDKALRDKAAALLAKARERMAAIQA